MPHIVPFNKRQCMTLEDADASHGDVVALTPILAKKSKRSMGIMAMEILFLVLYKLWTYLSDDVTERLLYAGDMALIHILGKSRCGC